ncbi:unnamed protein product, partial [marine sediment metagenome]
SKISEYLNKDIVVLKELERPKYRATEVVIEVNNAGFPKFRINPEHVQMWKSEDAKNPSKGYGIKLAGGNWYWYRSINKFPSENKSVGKSRAVELLGR